MPIRYKLELRESLTQSGIKHDMARLALLIAAHQDTHFLSPNYDVTVSAHLDMLSTPPSIVLELAAAEAGWKTVGFDMTFLSAEHEEAVPFYLSVMSELLHALRLNDKYGCDTVVFLRTARASSLDKLEELVRYEKKRPGLEERVAKVRSDARRADTQVQRIIGFSVILCHVPTEAEPEYHKDASKLFELLTAQPITLLVGDSELSISLADTIEFDGQAIKLGFQYVATDDVNTEDAARQLEGQLGERLKKAGLQKDYQITDACYVYDIYRAHWGDTANERLRVVLGIADDVVPSEYCCALTGLLIDVPVKLPAGSGEFVIVDQGQLQRAKLVNLTNPYTRQPYPAELEIDTALQSRIDMFMRGKVAEQFGFTTVVAAGVAGLGSPVTAAGDAHQQLLAQVAVYRQNGTAAKFFEALDSKKYGAALRRAASASARLADVSLQFVGALLQYRTAISLDINGKSSGGETALLIAARKNNHAIYDALLGCNEIDATITNADGKTAAEIMADRQAVPTA